MRLYSLVDLTGNVNMIEKFFTHLGQIGGLSVRCCVQAVTSLMHQHISS